MVRHWFPNCLVFETLNHDLEQLWQTNAMGEQKWLTTFFSSVTYQRLVVGVCSFLVCICGHFDKSYDKEANDNSLQKHMNVASVVESVADFILATESQERGGEKIPLSIRNLLIQYRHNALYQTANQQPGIVFQIPSYQLYSKSSSTTLVRYFSSSSSSSSETVSMDKENKFGNDLFKDTILADLKRQDMYEAFPFATMQTRMPRLLLEKGFCSAEYPVVRVLLNLYQEQEQVSSSSSSSSWFVQGARVEGANEKSFFPRPMRVFRFSYSTHANSMPAIRAHIKDQKTLFLTPPPSGDDDDDAAGLPLVIPLVSWNEYRQKGVGLLMNDNHEKFLIGISVDQLEPNALGMNILVSAKHNKNKARELRMDSSNLNAIFCMQAHFFKTHHTFAHEQQQQEQQMYDLNSMGLIASFYCREWMHTRSKKDVAFLIQLSTVDWRVYQSHSVWTLLDEQQRLLPYLQDPRFDYQYDEKQSEKKQEHQNVVDNVYKRIRMPQEWKQKFEYHDKNPRLFFQPQPLFLNHHHHKKMQWLVLASEEAWLSIERDAADWSPLFHDLCRNHRVTLSGLACTDPARIQKGPACTDVDFGLASSYQQRNRNQFIQEQQPFSSSNSILLNDVPILKQKTIAQFASIWKESRRLLLEFAGIIDNHFMPLTLFTGQEGNTFAGSYFGQEPNSIILFHTHPSYGDMEFDVASISPSPADLNNLMTDQYPAALGHCIVSMFGVCVIRVVDKTETVIPYGCIVRILLYVQLIKSCFIDGLGEFSKLKNLQDALLCLLTYYNTFNMTGLITNLKQIGFWNPPDADTAQLVEDIHAFLNVNFEGVFLEKGVNLPLDLYGMNLEPETILQTLQTEAALREFLSPMQEQAPLLEFRFFPFGEMFGIPQWTFHPTDHADEDALYWP